MDFPVMPQKKYPLELRERAVRMVRDALEADPGARRGIFRRIGDQLGVNPETLRSWVNQDQVDAGDRPGTTTAEAQRVNDLGSGNRELRRADQILKSASALFAAELDRPSKSSAPTATSTRTNSESSRSVPRCVLPA